LLEIDVNLAIEEPCAVDAALFLSVLDSLPKSHPLRLTSGDKGILLWECGNASGKLAKAILDKPLPAMPSSQPDDIAWETPDDFFTALTLGSISCQGNNTLASVGMYGVLLDNRKGFAVCSSDNITCSYYKVAKKPIKGAPERLTLPPDGAKVLSLVIEQHPGELFFGQDQLLFQASAARFLLKCSTPLKADLGEIVTAYAGSKQHAATISSDAINAFIKRVGVISETKKNAHVILTFKDGCVAMSFAEGIASSEETYLVDGLDECPDIDGIGLSAEKLARALSKVDTIVMDNADREVIVFTGLGDDFKYIVCGKRVV
jgi:hypothetical protein